MRGVDDVDLDKTTKRSEGSADEEEEKGGSIKCMHKVVARPATRALELQRTLACR